MGISHSIDEETLASLCRRAGVPAFPDHNIRNFYTKQTKQNKQKSDTTQFSKINYLL